MQTASAEQMGSAGGLFKTCRYSGAVLATTLIGVLFGTSATDETLYIMAAVMTVVSVGPVVASVRYGRQ